MDLISSIDPAHYPLIALGCALLCVAVLVIGFLLQAVSGIVEVVGSLVEMAVDLAQGGPVAWCGCGLLILALIVCAGLAFLLLNAPSSCAAHPTNFCQWLGFLP